MSSEPRCLRHAGMFSRKREIEQTDRAVYVRTQSQVTRDRQPDRRAQRAHI